MQKFSLLKIAMSINEYSIKEAFLIHVEVAGFEPATPCSQSRMLLV